MVYYTGASMDKLTCTDYVDSGKCQERFVLFCWSKSDSNYLDEQLKVFKKDDNEDFWLVKKLTMGESDFN